MLPPLLLIAGLIVSLASPSAEGAPVSPPSIENVAATLVVDGLEFIDGLACAPDGTLFFANPPAEQILTVKTDGTLRPFTTDSRGASGLAFGPDGNLYACETHSRSVSRWTLDGARTILAERTNGARFNGPKGIWVDPAGGIYFTDPVYSPVADRDIPTTDVYYIPHDGQPVRRVIEGLANPDGITGTPDGTTLYVAVNGDATVLAFTIVEPGTLTGQRLFAQQATNGMIADRHGDLYLTVASTITVIAADGTVRYQVPLPTPTTNAAFAGSQHDILFVSGPNSLYRFAAAPG